MIQSFKDEDAEKIFQGMLVHRLPSGFQRSALRKLLILNAATELGDLRVPPGNILEKLSGDRRGQYSIRINEQWRIYFKWNEGVVHNVEIVDYH